MFVEKMTVLGQIPKFKKVFCGTSYFFSCKFGRLTLKFSLFAKGAKKILLYI